MRPWLWNPNGNSYLLQPIVCKLNEKSYLWQECVDMNVAFLKKKGYHLKSNIEHPKPGCALHQNVWMF